MFSDSDSDSDSSSCSDDYDINDENFGINFEYYDSWLYKNNCNKKKFFEHLQNDIIHYNIHTETKLFIDTLKNKCINIGFFDRLMNIFNKEIFFKSKFIIYHYDKVNTLDYVKHFINTKTINNIKNIVSENKNEIKKESIIFVLNDHIKKIKDENLSKKQIIKEEHRNKKIKEKNELISLLKKHNINIEFKNFIKIDRYLFDFYKIKEIKEQTIIFLKKLYTLNKDLLITIKKYLVKEDYVYNNKHIYFDKLIKNKNKFYYYLNWLKFNNYVDFYLPKKIKYKNKLFLNNEYLYIFIDNP